jgi:hydroxymethylpyrimidine pyrophosphatase-like HAD family hydrolase
MASQLISVDWDWTIYDTANNQLMPGALDALERLRGSGYRILVHSCNNPKWIRKKCEELGVYVDYVWGESGMEAGKPVACVYVDDRAHHFRGNWAEEVYEILERASGRPIKDYRGPNYIRNPKREAELKHRSRDCPEGFRGCQNCGPVE